MAGGYTSREHLAQQGSVVERLGLWEKLGKTAGRNAAFAAEQKAAYEQRMAREQQRRDAQRQWAEDLRAREQRRAQQGQHSPQAQPGQHGQPGQQSPRQPSQPPVHVWVKGHPGVPGQRAGL